MISEDDYYHERPSYELPIPDLEPQPITSDNYMNCTPKKLELVGGFLVSKAEDNYWRDRLLSLLLKNQGLLNLYLAPSHIDVQPMAFG